MTDAFDKQVAKAIPAQVRVISTTRDSQSSTDVWDVGQLPDSDGMTGGACTSALLKVLYPNHKSPTNQPSWKDTLRQMRRWLDEKYIPQLTSSRMMNIQQPLYIVPPEAKGTCRAVLIGINYVGSKRGELSACHDSVRNVHEYLTKVHGFKDENITVLMDDGHNNAPTHKNILAAYRRLVKQSQTHDVAFCLYSGHGGRLVNKDGVYNETLIPVDFKSSGHIGELDLYQVLVRPMPAGVVLTCLMDCCHSGAVADLPYRFQVVEEGNEMYRNDGFDFSAVLGLTLLGGAVAGVAAATAGMQSEDTGGQGAVDLASGAGGANSGDGDGNCCSEICDSCCGCFSALFEDCP